MSNWKRIAIIVVLLASATVVVIEVKHHKLYPYGYRTCCLPCMMNILDQYANDHTNWFPNGGKTALDALQELYPKYTSTDISILAGISGEIRATRNCIMHGHKLTAAESSWIYFPGFRRYDDGHVAIIWECKAGITMNGERSDGHAVGFADGEYDQIPSTKWDSFVRNQEILRLKILASRKLQNGLPITEKKAAK